MKKIIAAPEALLQEVSGEKARIVARESGFVRRKSELDPVLFARTFCLSLLDGSAVTLLSPGLEVSATASALCQRFARSSSVGYFRRLLRLTLCELDRAADPPETDIPLSSRFRGVCLADGTTPMLPERLAERFPGAAAGPGRPTSGPPRRSRSCCDTDSIAPATRRYSSRVRGPRTRKCWVP